MKYFLGIDTSNYTTSVALCDADGTVCCQKKQPLKVNSGERGLRQSDALFAHTVNLPIVLEALFDAFPNVTPTAIGYSDKPRNIKQSYMPCFLAGTGVARSLSASMHIPAYAFSHQSGHIMAAVVSDGDQQLLLHPFLAFHVSGGTTDLVMVCPENGDFSITPVGTSLDLHAGQLIDRVGVMLELPFPCGAGLETLAASFDGTKKKPKICVSGCNCNLSGGENQAKLLKERNATDAEIAFYTFSFIEETLVKMTENALAQYPDIPVLFAGGVMSNQLMRKHLSLICCAHFAAPSFSADNAAGVALLARTAYLHGDQNDKSR